jgi:hypothetical protein
LNEEEDNHTMDRLTLPGQEVRESAKNRRWRCGTAAAGVAFCPLVGAFYLFEQVLELPFASGGAGHAGRAHSADEYATIAGLRTHMRQSIAFLHRFSLVAGAGR